MKISKRDIKVFILGLLTAFLKSIIFEWGNELDDFKRGFMDGINGRPYSVMV